MNGSPPLSLPDGKYFHVSELACRHCGRVEISPALIPTLDRIREIYGRPMIVNSGYRCQIHNFAIGGGPEHPAGEAADIRIYNGRDALDLARAALSFGIKRIGIASKAENFPVGKAFIHIGISPNLPAAIWTY